MVLSIHVGYFALKIFFLVEKNKQIPQQNGIIGKRVVGSKEKGMS